MNKALLLLALGSSLFAATPEDSIRKVLSDQVAAWNQGDVKTFMDGYENSPNTTFVGATITKGHAAVLERYISKYPSKEKMGTLTFSDLEIRMLGTDYASVIGHFHLDRTKDAGGDASGVFTLLFQKTTDGWKIIQDHTS
jgi:uncharacterized protein (TIGR02246 family)